MPSKTYKRKNTNSKNKKSLKRNSKHSSCSKKMRSSVKKMTGGTPNNTQKLKKPKFKTNTDLSFENLNIIFIYDYGDTDDIVKEQIYFKIKKNTILTQVQPNLGDGGFDITINKEDTIYKSKENLENGIILNCNLQQLKEILNNSTIIEGDVNALSEDIKQHLPL